MQLYGQILADCAFLPHNAEHQHQHPHQEAEGKDRHLPARLQANPGKLSSIGGDCAAQEMIAYELPYVLQIFNKIQGAKHRLNPKRTT